MKVLKSAILSIVIGAIVAMTPTLAVDVSVDGDLGDWGLSQILTDDWSDPATWIPTVDGISFFVEDNQDPLNVAAINYNASYTGVHIYGNATWQATYREPLLVGNRAEPYGGTGGRFGEMYDIEAMYVTENDTYIFVLIITSTESAIGDLALDFGPGGGYGYEYGVNFYRSGDTQGVLGGVYMTPTDNDWAIPSPFPENAPYKINFSSVDPASDLCVADISETDLGVNDFGRTNYAFEVAIPKSCIGSPELPDKPATAVKRFWITEYCGNDSGPSIPEFISILIPAGILLGSVYYFTRRER
ncbi:MULTISPECIES: hypothetical protein [unclassified Archaeoglobus]|jgi:hypothetical protein|uniref:hypothetical protein n=1 Tax=unclassified Archaeoglobus TaxID=2643606 RepID=UPI0025C42416|nr:MULTISPECIES: hypothetical protein [unclassified Archaeoglobus]